MSITLNTKAYNFAGLMNGIATYQDRSAGLASGFSALSARVQVTVQNSKSHVSWKLRLPVVNSESSACSCPGDVLRTSIADIVIQLGASATLAERTDFALRLKDLVASPEFQASIINLGQPNA